MAHDPVLKEKAKEMFVLNGFSMDTIGTMLPGVSRKTLYNWRDKENWEAQRRERVVKASNRRERLEEIVDRLLDELNVTLDPKLIFSLGKIIAAIKASAAFRFTDEIKSEESNTAKGLTPETLDEIEKKILNL
ncbi:MAG: hypothetical protein HKUEN01_31780 [Candidatus Kuenenia stuttgartiensis]|nr:MAG: hypothetical protein HKUEN01_31780 [Candidatus Kuenenia stuttgartiensis]